MFWDIWLHTGSGRYPNSGIPERPYGHKSRQTSNSNQEHLLLLLCTHRWATERCASFLSPSLGLQPCPFSLSFGFNLGSGCGEGLLCGFSAALDRSLSFHRCPPSGTLPALMLMSYREANQIQKPSLWGKTAPPGSVLTLPPPDRDTVPLSMPEALEVVFQCFLNSFLFATYSITEMPHRPNQSKN